MQQPDIITIVLCAVLTLLAILTPMASPFFRFRKFTRNNDEGMENSSEEAQEEKTMPGITILLTTHKNALQLEKHIESFLTQDYPADYQVIVVAEKGDSDTEDVLKRHSENSRLYYTMIPKSSRYMSRKKLAVTLGVKAARHEWIVMTEPECAPASSTWLRSIAENCNEDITMVTGYCKFGEETPSYCRFKQLQTALYLMRKTIYSTAFRAECTLLAFRKSTFIEGHGYRGYLQFIGGEYDFFVNKYAQKGNTAVALEPQSWVMEDEPLSTKWRNKHLYYMDARKHLLRRHSARILFNTDNLLLHAHLIATLATAAYAIFTQQWIVLGGVFVFYISSVLIRYTLAKPVLKFFQEELPMPIFYIHEIATVWHNARHALRYWRADKYDFTTHKQ